MLTGKAYLKSLPKKRMGAGALIIDKSGRILMVKPSYKDHWSIPGGVVGKDESPREAAEREVVEEIGLKIEVKRLLAVSYNRGNREMDENLQWLFYGGVLTDKDIRQIKVDGKEISEFRLVNPEKAVEMASPGLRGRLALYKKILNSSGALYLENNRGVYRNAETS